MGAVDTLARTKKGAGQTADPIARFAAMKRQDLFYQLQAQMSVPVEMPAGQGGERPAARSQLDQRSIAREMGGGAPEGPAISATAR